MAGIERVTRPTVAVLRAIADADAAGELVWGLAIVEATSLATGTVYPILRRLREAEWVQTADDEGGHLGAPRTLYRLTEAGRAGLSAAETRLASVAPRASRARPR